MNKLHEWIQTGLLAVLVVLVLVGGNQSDSRQVGGSTSDDWNVGGALSVTGATTLTGVVTQAASSTINGITEEYIVDPIDNTASTSLCTLLTPPATTTAAIGDIWVATLTSTSTSYMVTVATSTANNTVATTSLLFGFQVGTSTTATVTSTTSPTGLNGFVFAPNTRINVSARHTFAGGDAGALNSTYTLTGECGVKVKSIN